MTVRGKTRISGRFDLCKFSNGKWRNQSCFVKLILLKISSKRKQKIMSMMVKDVLDQKEGKDICCTCKEMQYMQLL